MQKRDGWEKIKVLKEFGRSVYISDFDDVRESLGELSPGFLFTSFHISEEFDEAYCGHARDMCRWLADKGFSIIGDVSPKTLERFGCSDAFTFASEMGLSVVRLDYGFSKEEIRSLARRMPVAVNASTPDYRLALEFSKEGAKVYAIHNFYPRPETGLDAEYFRRRNQELAAVGVRVLAFIPGDCLFRGPVFAGLPTLERHRGLAPYVCYCSLCVHEPELYGVLTGDGGLSPRQKALIEEYRETGIISVPAVLTPNGSALYERVFTVRPDSPERLARLEESREYGCFGKSILPDHCVVRSRGAITLDNLRYARYTGEVQIIRENLPADERVNVIGQVEEGYEELLDCIKGGSKLKLVSGKPL